MDNSKEKLLGSQVRGIIHERRHFLFRTKVHKEAASSEVVTKIMSTAKKDLSDVIAELESSPAGLNTSSVAQRFTKYGENVIAREIRPNWAHRLFKIYINPLIILLTTLALISAYTADARTAIVIAAMIVFSVTIRFFQENQAYNAAESLRAMVRTFSTVIRDGKILDVHLEEIVPGDVVKLSAGDIIPADCRIIVSKDLSVNQSLLTGEALPVEKHAQLQPDAEPDSPLGYHNICFMGSNVQSGSATALVVATGSDTYFGSIAKDIVGEREVTDFDRGIAKFTWLMIGFMAVLVPLVFFINGTLKHDWVEAFLFATAVAVGLTPELLPALIAVNLTKGSVVMAKKKVIVKRLSAIQNFGAINVLCSDKTGTLTRNEVVLMKNIDISGATNAEVLKAAFINSAFQTGFHNLMDNAVVKHGEENDIAHLREEFKKIDELPFDFERRRLSIIAENKKGECFIYTKGAIEETLVLCTHYRVGDESYPLDDSTAAAARELAQNLNLDGFSVVAVAERRCTDKKTSYDIADEINLTLLGFIAFLDPPKESAKDALADLARYGVAIKVLTGDNEYVTQKVCREVGLDNTHILRGGDIAKMSDEELKAKVGETTIFARLLPEHKRRIVLALKDTGSVVGFLGDGINDAPALRTADVGISVNTATDIAKESADIILLEMSLSVLVDGVIEGRRVFANIVKYIKMGASSNFGNMFSILGASAFFPFLPMTSIQILANNLLYDISQTAIPTDNVDDDYLLRPRKWEISGIARYIAFLGPVSSLFDYATFGLMWYVFDVRNTGNSSLFQTGWFIESLASQAIIVHIIRSRKFPFLETIASTPLIISTFGVLAVGIAIVLSPLAEWLGFEHPPVLFWPWLVAIISIYVLLAQAVKMWYVKKFGDD